MTEAERSDDEVLGSDTSGTVHVDFDWLEVSPSTAVAETVAIAAKREPTGLEPLYESIDPDAFDTVVRSMGTASRRGDATVTFALDGHQVTVHPSGTVVVRPN